MLKSIFPLSLLTFLSRVSGFVREFVLYRALGGSATLDAFILAFRLPNQTRRFFAEGSFNQALFPQMAQAQENGDYDEFLTQAFLFLFIVVGIFSLSTYYFPLFWVGLVAPKLTLEKSIQVSVILSYTGFYAFFMSIAAFFGTILQLHKKLYPMALAPLITNVLMIALITSFGAHVDQRILGYGVFVAGFCQCTYVVLSAWKYRFSFSSKMLKAILPAESKRLAFVTFSLALIVALSYGHSLRVFIGKDLLFFWLLSYACYFVFKIFSSPHLLLILTLKNFLKLSSVGALIVLNSIVDLRYLSAYGDGAYSFWNLCERVTDLPFAVLVSSLYLIFTSHYMKMHQHPVSKNHLELKAGLFILLLVVPCTLGLSGFSEPISAIFYSDSQSVATASNLLRVFSLGIIPLTLNKIYLSIAIVRQKQDLILWTHFVGSILNLVFNFLFDLAGLQMLGILYSTLITVTVQALLFEFKVPFFVKIFRLPRRYFFQVGIGFLLIYLLTALFSPYLMTLAPDQGASLLGAMIYTFEILLTSGFIAMIYFFIVLKPLKWLWQDFKVGIELKEKEPSVSR